MTKSRYIDSFCHFLLSKILKNIHSIPYQIIHISTFIHEKAPQIFKNFEWLIQINYIYPVQDAKKAFYYLVPWKFHKRKNYLCELYFYTLI